MRGDKLVGQLLVLGHWVKAMCAVSTTHSHSQGSSFPKPRRDLPAKVLVGYATNCNDGVIQAVRQGVNVVVWSFMEIQYDATNSKNQAGKASIQWNSLDLDCIRKTIDLLDNEGYNDTLHLTSFGGWNGPHLDSKLSASEWFDTWQKAAGDVFHGIDWDLEGHDDLASPTNVFSIDCLEKMGSISRLAKEQGYIIGMAPPQSYLDTGSSKFSRSVKLQEPDRPWHPEFHYFGANVYGYLLAHYHFCIDFVSIQFYESYSRAAMNIYGPSQVKPEEYLESYVNDLVSNDCSILIDFENDPSTNLSKQRVPLPLSKLVLGFANGWAVESGEKTLFVEPEAIRRAYRSLVDASKAPRGFMFWVIGEEGKNNVALAASLGDILQNRGNIASSRPDVEL